MYYYAKVLYLLSSPSILVSILPCEVELPTFNIFSETVQPPSKAMRLFVFPVPATRVELTQSKASGVGSKLNQGI